MKIIIKGIVIKGEMRKSYFKNIYIVILLCLAGCSQQTPEQLCETEINASTNLFQVNDFEKKKFFSMIESDLPKFQEYFKEAAQLSDVDWRMIAAIGFQESQWNPKAVSAMGVQGIMMLTEDTAKDFNVTDRQDPEQNILAGSLHFSNINHQISNLGIIDERFYFTLTAYNIGFSNFRRAWKEYESQQSPEWKSFKKPLSELSGKEVYFVDLNNYPRGRQAIDFTEKVSDYYLLLGAYTCLQN